RIGDSETDQVPDYIWRTTQTKIRSLQTWKKSIPQPVVSACDITLLAFLNSFPSFPRRQMHLTCSGHGTKNPHLCPRFRLAPSAAGRKDLLQSHLGIGGQGFALPLC
ncbi:hypothetical protein CLAIMM_09201, partial [Cladophialophora immunda]